MAQLTCARCGESFTPFRPNQKFCGSSCQVAHNRAENRANREAARKRFESAVCRGCDKTYTPRQSNQLYCSMACGKRIQTRERLGLKGPSGIIRPCEYCTTDFSSVDGRTKYCGEECARTAKSLGNARYLYGITMQEYRRLWLKQSGVCAICKLPERTQRNRLLTIDHDHETGHIRGLLCSQCNRAVGLLQDDPKVIEAAAAYVRRHRQIPLFN